MNTPSNFSQLVDIFLDVMGAALPVIIGLAFAVFIWGLVKFIFRIGGDDSAVKEGKNLMVWGLIALFILVSVGAILRFFYSDIGFSKPFGSILLPQ